MRHSVDMEGLSEKPFVPNSRHPGQSYQATFENNTAQSLTITVTNQNVLADGIDGVTFVEPAQGALTVAAGAIGILSEPYVCLKLTLAGAGAEGEAINIMEAG